MVSICFFEKCGPCDFVHTQLCFTVIYTEYTIRPYVLNSWCCFWCQKFVHTSTCWYTWDITYLKCRMIMVIPPA